MKKPAFTPADTSTPDPIFDAPAPPAQDTASAQDPAPAADPAPDTGDSQPSESDPYQESSDFMSGLDGVLGRKPEDPSSPPPAEDKAAATDEDLQDLPKNASERTKADWKALKARHRQETDGIRKELDELRKKASTPQNTADIEALKQELETIKQRETDAQKRLAAFDLEQSEEYQQNIGMPLAKANTVISEYIKEFELDATELAQAVMEESPLARNRKLIEITSGMDELNRQEFKRVLDDTRTLVLQAQKAREEADKSLAYIKQQREQETQTQKTRYAEALASEDAKSWSSLQSAIPDILKDPAVAAEVKRVAESADFLEINPEIHSYARYSAAAMPVVLKALKSRDAELANLKQELARRSGATPKTRETSVPLPDLGDDTDFMSGLDQVLGVNREQYA